ncbi:hypothetical protein D3C81_1511650 [compost metagenome]
MLLLAVFNAACAALRPLMALLIKLDMEVPCNPSILVIIGSRWVDLSYLKQIVEIATVSFTHFLAHRLQLLDHGG